MEEIYEGASFASTFSLRAALGARVLTPSGHVMGRIKSIQSDPSVAKVKGVLLSRGAFNKDLYIGREYFSSFTSESFILKDEPILLLKGKVVLSHEGQRVGRVVDVVRVESSNKLSYLAVKRWFANTLQVKPSHIASMGNSIILKEGLHVPKRSFWRRSS